jgi:hypothetical protein
MKWGGFSQFMFGAITVGIAYLIVLHFYFAIVYHVGNIL